ncbi:hypothetical protein ElyMa_000724700 [Elysia marginata]|uniref:Uncharacterized protein n=1 Tax=Elysia marginata TaxID=1093978 RepID=A0AAV4GM50_9GAST|nr:hypothetical protein ElyMa_000724700 [Elysia marginata]
MFHENFVTEGNSTGVCAGGSGRGKHLVVLSARENQKAGETTNRESSQSVPLGGVCPTPATTISHVSAACQTPSFVVISCRGCTTHVKWYIQFAHSKFQTAQQHLVPSMQRKLSRCDFSPTPGIING